MAEYSVDQYGNSLLQDNDTGSEFAQIPSPGVFEGSILSLFLNMLRFPACSTAAMLSRKLDFQRLFLLRISDLVRMREFKCTEPLS